MHKRFLMAAVLLVIALGVFWQARIFPLAAYALFPFLFIPSLFFYEEKQHWVFGLSGVVILVLAGCFIFRNPAVEILMLITAGFLVMLLILYYRRSWEKAILIEKEREQIASGKKQELGSKFHARLESLHRLENQVANLISLFETARDFSECLSFEVMAKLLRDNIMPELPFERMRILTLEGELDSQNVFLKNYVIAKNKVEEVSVKLSEIEENVFDEAIQTRQMVRLPLAESEDAGESKKEAWVFPLVIDGQVKTLCVIEGAHEDSLVRFEVLMSHLVLQVKKIILYEKVKELSIVDGLTGVYVRRHFLERFGEELQRSLRLNLPMAVLILDIDHFKRYNDQFGHLVGDATLKEVAHLLRENIRKVDVVARYGGEEFIVVLPEAVGASALEIAERIRSNIARHHFRVYDVEARVTVSVGISLFPGDILPEKRGKFYTDLGFDLIRFADKALYRAKEEGRNRIYRYQDL